MASGQWKDSTRSDRLPADWATVVRPHVFALYGDVCHFCGLPGADTVDHVVPGDDHSYRNLRPIHEDPCHKHKTQLEAQAARARNRANARMEIEPHPGLM